MAAMNGGLEMRMKVVEAKVTEIDKDVRVISIRMERVADEVAEEKVERVASVSNEKIERVAGHKELVTDMKDALVNYRTLEAMMNRWMGGIAVITIAIPFIIKFLFK